MDAAGATLPVGLGALLFLGTLHLQRVLGFTALGDGPGLPGAVAARGRGQPGRLLSGRPLRAPARPAGGLAPQAAGLLLLLGAGPGDGFLAGIAPGFMVVGAGAPIAWVP